MRIFGIQSGGEFKEYIQTPFEVDHEEAVLESWLESNPDGILEDGKLLFVGRQVSTDLGGFIDLLGIDRVGDVVVIELKRDRTPRETLAQALEYASFAERLDAEQLQTIFRSYLNDESLNLAEHHRGYFELGPDEAIAFNKDQRIVILGQHVTPEIRQTASFLRSKGLKVTCVEFTFFQADGDTRLLSEEIVVGKDAPMPRDVTSGSLPVVTQDDFMASLDDNGRFVFSRVLQFARERQMPIHWGTKGFSLNADLEGTHVGICWCFPPKSVHGQSVCTVLRRPGGMASKTAAPEGVLNRVLAEAEATGLFKQAGGELKCRVDRHLSEEEVNSLIAWCETVAEEIRKQGLTE
ncbi:MAG: hypothetical protein ABFD90_17145 [Phycisphaerales bacterium]